MEMVIYNTTKGIRRYALIIYVVYGSGRTGASLPREGSVGVAPVDVLLSRQRFYYFVILS